MEKLPLMGTFDLPPAFLPLGISGVVGLLVATLFTMWGGRAKRR